MNVVRPHFAFLNGAPLKDDEQKWIASLKQELAPEIKSGRIVYAEDPAEADIIAVLESSLAKDRNYLRTLSKDSDLKAHWQKTFTINYEDAPMGLFQGLYTSLSKGDFDEALHRSWPPIWVPCAPIYEVTDEQIHFQKPKLLFSFLGSKSHPIRDKILSLYASANTKDICVEDVDRWFNHSEDEKAKYVSVSLNSRFVLCPRGRAAFTYRICEAMALGRVPVVVADDWVPFSFEDKAPYYLQIPESQVEGITDRLREAEPKAEEYGFNARRLWNKYSAAATRVFSALSEIKKLKDSGTGPKSYEECASRWNSPVILKRRGWTFSQRLNRKLKRLIGVLKG